MNHWGESLAHESNSFACIKLCNCEAMYTEFDLRKFRETKSAAEGCCDGWTIASLLFAYDEVFLLLSEKDPKTFGV